MSMVRYSLSLDDRGSVMPLRIDAPWSREALRLALPVLHFKTRGILKSMITPTIHLSFLTRRNEIIVMLQATLL
jgi:hypothetical protein